MTLIWKSFRSYKEDIKSFIKRNFSSYSIKWESTKKIGTADLTYICSLLLYYSLNEETNSKFTKTLLKKLTPESRKSIKLFFERLPSKDDITKDILKESINLIGMKYANFVMLSISSRCIVGRYLIFGNIRK